MTNSEKRVLALALAAERASRDLSAACRRTESDLKNRVRIEILNNAEQAKRLIVYAADAELEVAISDYFDEVFS